MRSIVASACWASAPATPPISPYASRVRSFLSRSRFSHRRATAKASERQRPPRPLHRVHHLLDERLVLEPVAALPRRLHHRPPQRLRREPGDGVSRLEDRPRGRRAREQRNRKSSRSDSSTWTLGLGGEPSEERREPCLHLRRVQREQLLELVHHEESLVVPQRHRRTAETTRSPSPVSSTSLDAPKQVAHGLGVSGQLDGERLSEAERRARARRRA